jgi:hypothetical protein
MLNMLLHVQVPNDARQVDHPGVRVQVYEQQRAK